MNKNTDSKDFYILESVLLPGTYYKDNWKGFTTAASQAERYPSPEKALERWKDPSKWYVCKVHLDMNIHRI